MIRTPASVVALTRHAAFPLAVLVLAFVTASYEVPRLLGRPYPTTLSVEAFQRYRDIDLTSRPEAMALAVLIALLTTLAALAYLRLVGGLARRSL